jgi:hypothetical protein
MHLVRQKLGLCEADSDNSRGGEEKEESGLFEPYDRRHGKGHGEA